MATTFSEFLSVLFQMQCSGTNCLSANTGPFASDLFPSIFQCFIIILMGYVSARFGIMTSNNAQGLNCYISYFALPAVFFKAIVTIDFSNVNWPFLGALCLGKLIIFLGAIVVTIFVSRPISLSLAGIFAIFVSQSNDVALGYPILLSLLPDHAHYIYLVAPMQLVLLNPIAFVLMEVQKLRNTRAVVPTSSTAAAAASHTNRRPRLCFDSIVWRVFSNVIFNPLVFTVLAAVGLNFVFKGTVPPIINMALTVLADSFSGTALFVLGFNMLGKLTSIGRKSALLIFALLFSKLVILPFLMYQMVVVFNPMGSNSSSYRFFAFLYGGIPTAPPVFLFASNYHVAVDVVASGLVLGTFISFPWTFLSARLVTLSVIKESDYANVIRGTSLNIAILSLICVVWVLGVFFLSRRYRRMPHAFTTGLLFSIFLSCTGLISSKIVLDSKANNIASYIPFIIFFVGTIGNRVWVVVIALALTFLKTRGLCFVLYYRWAFFVVGYGFPVVITGILMMFATDREPDVDLAFQFGKNQRNFLIFTMLIVSTIVLTAAFLATIGCMIGLLRHDNARDAGQVTRTEADNAPTVEDPSIDRQTSDLFSDPHDPKEEGKPAGWLDSLSLLFLSATTHDDNPLITNSSGLNSAVIGTGALLDDYDDLTSDGHVMDAALEEWLRARRCTWPSHFASPELRRVCQRNLIRYRKSTRSFLQEAGETELGDVDKEYQTLPHIILFALSCISMFMGILLCVWRLLHESLSGIYLMLEFLDSFFNFGQGFFVFALFGLDTDLIILPCKKRWRKLLYGVEEIYIPDESQLDADTKLQRDHFVRYHLKKCKRDLVSRQRYHLVVYDDVFRGDQFVAWLQAEGMASSVGDALSFGGLLLSARVFHHVKREHHLHNLPYFYCFSNEFDHLMNQEESSVELVDR